MRSHKRETLLRGSVAFMVLWWQVVRDQRRNRADLWNLISSHPSRDGHAAQESLHTALQQCLSVYPGMAPDPYSLFQSSLPTCGIFMSQKKIKFRVDPHTLNVDAGISVLQAGISAGAKKPCLPPVIFVIKRHFGPGLTLTGAKKETFDPFSKCLLIQ